MGLEVYNKHLGLPPRQEIDPMISEDNSGRNKWEGCNMKEDWMNGKHGSNRFVTKVVGKAREASNAGLRIERRRWQGESQGMNKRKVQPERIKESLYILVKDKAERQAMRENTAALLNK